MRAQKIEIGLAEGAKILGVSRASAYIFARSGEIEGARKVADRLWVAPISSFEALRARRQAEKAAS